jgi:hypothetical protein
MARSPGERGSRPPAQNPRGLGHWTQFRDGTLGIVDRALRVVIKAYANGRCALRWGLPGGKYREAAARLKAAGFAWVREQTFKDALRGKPPPKTRSPPMHPAFANSFSRSSVSGRSSNGNASLDPPEAWLEGCDTTLRQPAQNDEIAQAKWPREPQETWKVAPVATRTHRAPCNLQPPPLSDEPEDRTPLVPLRASWKAQFAASRIA